MWVLILTTFAGNAVNAIPGYRSEQACVQSGTEYKSRLAIGGGFICIPGPSQPDKSPGTDWTGAGVRR